MINEEYEIKSGIDKSRLPLLNEYLLKLEGTKAINSQYLSKVIDEVPGVLYEPKKVSEMYNSKFMDLAFVYHNNTIVAHFCHEFHREKTKFGYKTSVKLLEEFNLENIPEEICKKYVTERALGNLEIRIEKYEKSHQK